LVVGQGVSVRDGSKRANGEDPRQIGARRRRFVSFGQCIATDTG
jgi:hypothetical protein